MKGKHENILDYKLRLEGKLDLVPKDKHENTIDNKVNKMMVELTEWEAKSIVEVLSEVIELDILTTVMADALEDAAFILDTALINKGE